uniref:Protein Tob2 n=1 Tax=Cacopsylla melanoneura TaxID=428564 RepID=A0A8D8TA64_9HEMI
MSQNWRPHRSCVGNSGPRERCCHSGRSRESAIRVSRVGDPGEVSYRIGEKGDVKILYRESWDKNKAATTLLAAPSVQDSPLSQVESPHAHNAAMDREVHKTFNPEARVFRPVEVCLANLSLGGGGGSTISGLDDRSSSPSPTKGSPTFLPRNTQPLTFTTASFAQTKFGSTKLKTNSKRTNRMSPTEFSNYIKQRALLQQQHNNHSTTHAQQHLPPTLYHSPGGNSPHYSPLSGNTAAASRSLSPSYYFSQTSPLAHHQSSPQIPFQGQTASNSLYSQRWSQVDSEPSSPYHHLLVAN